MSATTTDRYIASCKACGCHTSALSHGWDARKTERKPATVYMNARGYIVLDCRKCGEPRYAKLVRGKFSAKHECSDRCMSSTGTVCECSCAGKNHGGAHVSA